MFKKLGQIYIPIWFYSNRPSHNNFARANTIYIPIWFYSNPSSIIPYFPSFTRTIFVDPTFSLHFLRIFDKILYRIFLFIPLYKTFVDPPRFLLYRRSTTILTAAVLSAQLLPVPLSSKKLASYTFS